ncbi:hypothetical protein Niako_2752 [Niastella koreensis GR20-10]|uniref:MORN variant repeat-containing protein n=2 Tax=Niastella koreensis TaxID=354356 RepID=G8T8B8_NIAKG|nr:hypothetical protein [Niastella koreensis]AEV99088.1 hypothetical protein Niako_2752 [Niastella koreensis GR20-10]
MEKHTNIPEGATWNNTYNQWELGKRNAAGKEIGIWEEWHVDGHLCGRVDYGDGAPPFITNRFHPDGTLAEEGNWYGGQKWLGTLRFIKCDQPTSEVFPEGDAARNSIVWIAEYDYIEEGIYNAQRYYDRQNRPVSAKGTPLPKRPASVPEGACYMDWNNSSRVEAHWVVKEFDTQKKQLLGDYIEWDLNGNLLEKRTYDRSTGKQIERHEYINGKITVSKWYVGEDLFVNCYYEHIHSPVVKISRVYRNNNKDRTDTFFDEAGRELFSIRSEEVSECHERKYYNAILVYEGIQDPDKTKPPVSVRYFYPGGATLIDYTTNGNDTGIFQLYDEAGLVLLTMLQGDEAFINRKNRWNYFVPEWTTGPEHTIITTYLHAIVQNFRKEYELNVLDKKIKELPVPQHLQAELDKVDWKKITSAWGSGEDLPSAINGLLSEDEEIGRACEERIWWKMAYHGELYEATYATATIIARMLPLYKQATVVEQRLFGLLYKVMIQPGLRNRGYSEMIAAMEFLIPQLFQWAGDTNPVTARRAQHILIHVGKDLPETEAFLQREWQNTALPDVRRGYALYCLGWLYWLAEDYEKINTQFLPAFHKEKNILLRVIQAIFLIRISEDNAADSWVAEIINTLARQDAAIADLDSMQALIGEYGSPEFLINFLQNTDPAALAKHIRTLIMEMHSHDRKYQETLLLAISPVLFSDKIIDYKKVRTEGSRNTLLALADLAEKDPDFMKHHSKTLLKLELPLNAQQIRDLAANEDKK